MNKSLLIIISCFLFSINYFSTNLYALQPYHPDIDTMASYVPVMSKRIIDNQSKILNELRLLNKRDLSINTVEEDGSGDFLILDILKTKILLKFPDLPRTISGPQVPRETLDADFKLVNQCYENFKLFINNLPDKTFYMLYEAVVKVVNLWAREVGSRRGAYNSYSYSNFGKVHFSERSERIQYSEMNARIQEMRDVIKSKYEEIIGAQYAKLQKSE